MSTTDQPKAVDHNVASSGTSSSANSPKAGNVRTNKPYTYSSSNPNAASPLGVFQISSHNDPNAVGHVPEGETWGATPTNTGTANTTYGSASVAAAKDGNGHPNDDGNKTWIPRPRSSRGEGGNAVGGSRGAGGNWGRGGSGGKNWGFQHNGGAGYNSYQRGGFGFGGRGGHNGGVFYPNNSNNGSGNGYYSGMQQQSGGSEGAEHSGRNAPAQGNTSKTTTPSTTVIKIRGLPYMATREDVANFVEGYEIDTSTAAGHGRDSILIITKGGARGEGYVRFKDLETAERALHELHKASIGERYVELYESSPKEMAEAKEHQEQVVANTNPIVRVRGLPYSATAPQLRAFFDNIPEDEILHIEFCYSSDGKLTGDAFVELASKAGLAAAHAKHSSQLGNRYLEIIDSNQHEMEVIIHAAKAKKSSVIQQQRRANKAAAAVAQAIANGEEPSSIPQPSTMGGRGGRGGGFPTGSRGGRGNGGRGRGGRGGFGDANVDTYNMMMQMMMGAGNSHNPNPNPFQAMMEQMTTMMMASPQMMAMMGMAAGAAMANSTAFNPAAVMGAFGGSQRGGRGGSRGSGRGGAHHNGPRAYESNVTDLDEEPTTAPAPYSSASKAKSHNDTESTNKNARPINPITGKTSMFDVPWDAPLDSPQESSSTNAAAVAAVSAASRKGPSAPQNEAQATSNKREGVPPRAPRNPPPPNFPAMNPMLMMGMMNPQMMMAMMQQMQGQRPPSQWAVRVRGLPFSATESAVGAFFTDVNIAPQGVHLAYSSDDRPTGEAYVEVLSKEDMDRALGHTGRMMGKRYIEVFPSSGDDIVRLGGIPPDMFNM